MKKSFSVRDRLFFAFLASALAVFVIGFIAWNGFRIAHTEIRAFQDENIPRLKHSQHLSELGTALEAFSLIIPKAVNSNELDSHRDNLEKRISEIKQQIQNLSDIQNRMRDTGGKHRKITELILSVNDIGSNLENNLNSLLGVTRDRIDLEDKRKKIFGNISMYKNSIREKFRKKIDAANTRLQLNIQEVRDIRMQEGSDPDQTVNAFVAQADTLRNVMNALADSEKISGFLSIAASSQYPSDIEEMFAVFNSDLPSFMGRVNRLGQDEQIKADMKSLAKSGIGKEGIFEIRRQQFTSQELSESLTSKTKADVSDIRGKIETIVGLIDEESEKSSQETLKETGRAIRYIALLILVMIAMVGAVGFFTIRSISLPLKRISQVLKDVSEGDLTSETAADRNDEIGRMAGDLNNAVRNIRKIMEELTEAANSLYTSSGEMSAISMEMASSADEMNFQAETVAGDSEKVSENVGIVASAAKQADRSVSDIAAMSDEMSLTLRKMAEFAQKTSENVKEMARSGDEISSGIRNVAIAIEETTASLNEVARNTDKANRISQNASRQTEEIAVRMDALVSASKQIGKVVGVIKNIADQTNMLALNAAIEAAGAGESGRGFAVVAGEVKELAKQSADATDEIAEQIGQIQSSTDAAVETIAKISGIIRELAGINEFIASSAEEQTAVANEISKSVSGNAMEVKFVAGKANESSKLVEEIARSTVETSETAKEAARHIEELAKGIKNVADSSGEAARRVQNISGNIQGISTASKETSVMAGRTNVSSKKLAEMAAALSEIVKRFRLG